MNACSCGFGGSALFTLLLQVGAIVVGWIVVHKLSAARDFDKARREMVVKAVDSLSEDLTKLIDSARSYHTNARSVDNEDYLKLAFQDLSMRLNALMKICKSDSDIASCRASLLSLKRSTTGSHFEDEHSGPLDSSSETIKSITMDFLKVRQAMLGLKHRQFSES